MCSISSGPTIELTNWLCFKDLNISSTLFCDRFGRRETAKVEEVLLYGRGGLSKVQVWLVVGET